MMGLRHASSIVALAVAIAAAGQASPANAQAAGSAIAPTSEAAQLRAQIAAMEQREAETARVLEALTARIAVLEAARVPDGDAALMRGKAARSGLTAVRYGETVAALDRDDAAPAPAAQPGDDRKTPAPTEAAEDVARQQQGRFGERFGLEAGLTYSHFDNARINLNGFLALDAIFLGRISIDQVTADVLTADLTARYGVNPRLQVDVNVPYLLRQSNFESGGAGGASTSLVEKRVREHGLGDVSFGANYRLLTETAHRPDLVINARVKAPTGRDPFGVELVEVAGSQGNLSIPARLSTGSGVWGASLGASVLKTLDPLVLFGSVTYFHNFERHFADLDEAIGNQPGRAKVGDAIQYGAGVAFALNDKSSLSMSFTQRLVQRARLKADGDRYRTIVGSQANVGLVNLGGTFVISDRLTLISTVGIGLTQDTPNMVVSLRLPYRF